MAGSGCTFALVTCHETVRNDFVLYLQKAHMSKLSSVCALRLFLCTARSAPETSSLVYNGDASRQQQAKATAHCTVDISDVSSSTELLTPWALLRSWKLDNVLKNVLPSQSRISVPLSDLLDKTVAYITKIIDEIDLKFLSTLFNDSEKAKTFLDAKNARHHDKLLENVVRGIKASKKRSVERRTLMALLCSVLRRKNAYASLKQNIDCEGLESSDIRVESSDSGSAEESSTPIPPSKSKSRINLSLAVSKSDAGVFRRRYTTARRDWACLLSGNTLWKPPIFRNRVLDDSIFDVVRFILEDVQVLSWGTKSLEILDEDEDGVERVVTIQFPGLTRRRSPEDMYESFKFWLQGSSRHFDNHALSFSPPLP